MAFLYYSTSQMTFSEWSGRAKTRQGQEGKKSLGLGAMPTFEVKEIFLSVFLYHFAKLECQSHRRPQVLLVVLCLCTFPPQRH